MSILERYLQDGMTVADLRAELEHFPDDAKVVFKYRSGDHWRTTVAERVESIDEGKVKWTDYHSKLQVVDEDGDEEGDGSETTDVVILS